MFDLFDSYTLDYKTKCYIASKLSVEEDEYGNQIETYAQPKAYMFNIQPVTAESEIQAFGELAPKMKRALVSATRLQTERNTGFHSQVEKTAARVIFSV